MIMRKPYPMNEWDRESVIEAKCFDLVSCEPILRGPLECTHGVSDGKRVISDLHLCEEGGRFGVITYHHLNRISFHHYPGWGVAHYGEAALAALREYPPQPVLRAP